MQLQQYHNRVGWYRENTALSDGVDFTIGDETK